MAMATGAFDAFEEDFFREGDRLGNEPPEDFSDLDAATWKPLAAPLPARPPRPPGALAEGTPRPESIVEVAPAKPPPPRRATHWLRAHWIPVATIAGVLGVGLVARAAAPSEQRALSAVHPAPAAAITVPAAPTPAPEPIAAPTPPTDEPPDESIAEPPPVERLTPAQRRKKAEAAYAKGRTAFMAGDFRDSIRYFRRAVSADASLAKGYRAMGLAYKKLGDRPRAVRAFRAYLRAAPRAKDTKTIKRMIAELG